MSRETSPHYNAYVINSNLARPILKRLIDPYAYHERYAPEPAKELDGIPHVIVPEFFLSADAYKVYGFSIPRPVRLRVVNLVNENTNLNDNQRRISEQLARLGHGLSVELEEPDNVSLAAIYRHGRLGLQWSVDGEATAEHIDDTFQVSAIGVRGHSVTPSNGGLALLG